MTAPRDALAQLEVVMADIAKSDEAQDALPGYRATPESARAYHVAADSGVHWLRDHAETLRALLRAADGVKTTFCVDCGQHVTGPCGRDLCNVPEQYPLPEFGSELPLDTFPTLTKAPAND